jgi:hypothetical protein
VIEGFLEGMVGGALELLELVVSAIEGLWRRKR